MNSDLKKTCRCFSCGAEAPDIQGEVHRYMDSSPGCWKLFGDILEKEYADQAYWKNHRITVDAYAVQHYGVPSPQAIQSVNLHLASLHLIYVNGFDVKQADKGLTYLAGFKSELSWLTPPAAVGSINVTTILRAKNAEEHCELIYKWGKDAWEAWKEHHQTVQRFVEKHMNKLLTLH